MLDTFAGIPRSLRIGPWDFRLEIVSKVDDNHSFGRFSADRCLIEIRFEHPSPAYAVDTVLHEIFHAVYHVQNLQKDDEEERICTQMAIQWTQIWRDNPRLLDWVKKNLK